MNYDPHLSPIDFNKLAAYLDGNLPSDEMARMESYISSDVRLSAMMNEIIEIDNQIIDNQYDDCLFNNSQLSDTSLPEIDFSTGQDIFIGIGDSSDDILSSLFTDHFSLSEDNPLDMFDGDDLEMNDNNIFDDL